MSNKPEDILALLQKPAPRLRGPRKIVKEAEPKKSAKLVVKNKKKDNEQLPTNVSNIDEQRALRDLTRKLALGYGPEMVELLVDLARNARSETVRMESANKVMTYGGGRPPIINPNDMNIGHMMPRFTIIFGERQPDLIMDMEDAS